MATATWMSSPRPGRRQIAWYENTDGQGTFGDQQVITTEADGVPDVYAADLDGDGDMDVLSASRADDKIAWYENTDGQGTFGEQQVITTQATMPSSVYAADLDGDGDMDVLSASSGDDKIAWYENTDGQGTFGDSSSLPRCWTPMPSTRPTSMAMATWMSSPPRRSASRLVRKHRRTRHLRTTASHYHRGC